MDNQVFEFKFNIIESRFYWYDNVNITLKDKHAGFVKKYDLSLFFSDKKKIIILLHSL